VYARAIFQLGLQALILTEKEKIMLKARCIIIARPAEFSKQKLEESKIFPLSKGGGLKYEKMLLL